MLHNASEQASMIESVASSSEELATSTEDISNFVQSSSTTTSEIDHVISKFSNSKDSINTASSGIKDITSAMNTIGDSFTSISANIEEQTATTQEMSSNLQFINEKSTKIREETNRTGKSFFDISLKIDEIRLRTLANSEKIDSDTMIELSITDHLMWKWRVYNLILGYIKFETSSVGDSHSCRLGKWLDTLDHNNSDIKYIIDKIKEPHSNIHNLAKQAITEYNDGNIKACESILDKIDKNSKVVIGCLNELKVIMK